MSVQHLRMLTTFKLLTGLLQKSNTSLAIYRNKSQFLKFSPNAAVDKTVLQRYQKLALPADKIQATYIWIDGTGRRLRLKDRILDKKINCVDDLPYWIFDGAATGQACTETSDTYLVPRAMYRDPFKPGEYDIIVMCDTFTINGDPTKSNKRCKCVDTIEKAKDHQCWFGIEQEYTLLDIDGRPFGWPKDGYPRAQGHYYCGVGADRVFARDLAEAHIMACLYAGIEINGSNAEVLPSQWEYQIGPYTGVRCADDLWVSRYILLRIAEEMGLVVSFDPKPVNGPHWNGSGAHTNFSTKETRQEGGLKAIKEAIKKLCKYHARDIKKFDGDAGRDNVRRLIGSNESSNYSKFTWGVADRKSSIRIPGHVWQNGCGYFEDRRPAANCDPYNVIKTMVKTCVLDK